MGKDQKQHLEFARDIAENFNKTYGVDFFKLPEPHIEKTVEIIPGTDGRKMSKSYDNFIGIFDDEKTLKKKIMSIETGSETLEESKNPDTCNVYKLIEFFADSQKLAEIRMKYLAGNYGYGHAKLELLDILLAYFGPARKKYEMYMHDYSLVQDKLDTGNVKANQILGEKYRKLLEIVGL